MKRRVISLTAMETQIAEVENYANRATGRPLHVLPYDVRADLERRRDLTGYVGKHDAEAQS